MVSSDPAKAAPTASPIPDVVPPWHVRLVRSLAGLWDRMEWLFRRAERHTRRLEAEVRQLGLDILDRVDDLPFVPTLVPFPAIPNQYYGHGAYMGAAPALLADERWRKILAFLMPDVFLDVSAAVQRGATVGEVIPMFENNPVMCAFGTWHGEFRRSGRTSRHPNDLAGMEWDVFVDSVLIERWEAAGDMEKPAILRMLADTMVIAHASTADTVQEAAGVCQYEDVCRTPKTHLGGVRMDAWVDLFGRALALAEAPDLRSAMQEMSREPRFEEGEAARLYTFREPLPVPLALEPWRRLTGRRWFSIVLEIKSVRSTASLLGALVAELNARGLHVTAVCSFKVDEVAGIGAAPQRVDGELLPGPREVQFFHWAGDVQAAAEAGKLRQGQSVLFNGATLLAHQPDDAQGPYRILSEVIDELDELRRTWGLSVGVYVQEGDCDTAAVRLLSEMVTRWPATFELGFAWGGLVDECCLTPDGSDRRGLGSQAMLGWVGSARAWQTRSERAAHQDAQPGGA